MGFRAGSRGTMLLVRICGMGCCSKPVFIGLCWHPACCGNTATPQLGDCPISSNSNMLPSVEASFHLYKLFGFYRWKRFSCALYKPYKHLPSPL